MKVVNVKGTPDGAANYELEDGRIFRVILKLKTPDEQIASADHLTLEAVGYEITKDGAFVVDERYGEPVTLRAQATQLPLAGIRAGTETAKPGWVRQALPEGEVERDSVLEGVKKLKRLPGGGKDGDLLNIEGELYSWSEGTYEGLRRALLQQVQTPGTLGTAPDPEQLAALRP